MNEDVAALKMTFVHVCPRARYGAMALEGLPANPRISS
jgi:hypothetical protein